MRYPAITNVLFLHARLVAETGGLHGVRDLGMLESALARPRARFDRADLYPDLFTKAAALLDSLINNHPFVDGNKRTGFATVRFFIGMNGFVLIVNQREAEEIALRVATAHPKVDILAGWLREHSRVKRRS